MKWEKIKELEEPTIEILKEFKEANPWRGTIDERKEKFRVAFRKMRELYGIGRSRLTFAVPNRVSQWRASGWSSYNRSTGRITLRGRLSVITFLHEFGHALGKGEKGAVKFSLNLFEKVFPEQWEKLQNKQRSPRHNPFWVSPRKKKVKKLIEDQKKE